MDLKRKVCYGDGKCLLHACAFNLGRANDQPGQEFRNTLMVLALEERIEGELSFLFALN